MDLYSADKVDAFKEFIITLEKNKNNSRITNQILKSIQRMLSIVHTSGTLQWLKEQVESGNSYAQDYLGDLHYTGTGVKKSYEDAIRLFKLSAEQVNSHAQYNLAFMYTMGNGCKINQSKALEILRKSDAADCDDGKNFLKRYIEDGSYDLYIENGKLKEKIRELEKENEELKIEIEYRPGGKGYEKAKENAENLFIQLKMQMLKCENCCFNFHTIQYVGLSCCATVLKKMLKERI